MTGHVGQRRVGRGGNREHADRKAVETVGQVDGIRFRDEHEDRERQIHPPQVRNHLLEEGEDEARVVFAVVIQDEQHHADR